MNYKPFTIWPEEFSPAIWTQFYSFERKNLFNVESEFFAAKPRMFVDDTRNFHAIMKEFIEMLVSPNGEGQSR